MQNRQKIVIVFSLLAIVQGILYTAALPPWQSNDEHRHFEYAWLVNQYGPFVGPDKISIEFERRVLRSMYRFNYWQLCRQPKPEAIPSSFNDPSDRWSRYSRPQVGDERPLYYWLVGGCLHLAGDQDLLLGMYIGRAVSVLLFVMTVGATAWGSQRLFPKRFSMIISPPAFVLFLPMLGQMGASVSSDSIGALTGTLFFVSLIRIFKDSLTWKRTGFAMTCLFLALLSKKTALFLLPTTILAIVMYLWTQEKVQLVQQIGRLLGVVLILSIMMAIVLALLPGKDAKEWVEWRKRGWETCGPTRIEEKALDGDAALRVGQCVDSQVAQILPLETVRKLGKQEIILKGYVRSAAGVAKGRAYIEDHSGASQVKLVAGNNWHPFTLTHTVQTANPKWMIVRLAWEDAEGPLLFDKVTLNTEHGKNLLVNGSAEQRKSMLVSSITNLMHYIRIPNRIVDQLLKPQSWNLEAWREYADSVRFCFMSFWGLFGSVTVFLPTTWYQLIAVACLLSLMGAMLSFFRRDCKKWQIGYLVVLMGSLIFLLLQTCLPVLGMRGTGWKPQGRYLFPGIFAIAIMMTWGWDNLLPKQWRNQGGAALAVVFLIFDALCLLVIIIPYYSQP